MRQLQIYDEQEKKRQAEFNKTLEETTKKTDALKEKTQELVDANQALKDGLSEHEAAVRKELDHLQHERDLLANKLISLRHGTDEYNATRAAIAAYTIQIENVIVAENRLDATREAISRAKKARELEQYLMGVKLGSGPENDS